MLEYLSFCQWDSRLFVDQQRHSEIQVHWASCSKMLHAGCQLLVPSPLRPTLSVPFSDATLSLNSVSPIAAFLLSPRGYSPLVALWSPEHTRVVRSGWGKSSKRFLLVPSATDLSAATCWCVAAHYRTPGPRTVQTTALFIDGTVLPGQRAQGARRQRISAREREGAYLTHLLPGRNEDATQLHINTREAESIPVTNTALMAFRKSSWMQSPVVFV